MKNQPFKRTELALYYIAIFFILREWLVPIMSLTGTGYMGLILLFIAITLICSLFRIHFLISFFIKVFYISWFSVFVYSDQSFFSSEGLSFLLQEAQINLAMIVRADWVNVTDPFRTLLFYILIWMLIYLIHHWITVRFSIFYFLLLTVFFIGTLDTFTEYDGTFAIVKVMFLGLLLSAFLFIKRLLKQVDTKLDWKHYIKLVLPVVLLLSVFSSAAVFLPKSEPQWPDPVPFLKAATGQGSGLNGKNGVSKVGYGENDSQLGGAFVADDAVVFLAEAQTKQYWRVETKDVYTSKGWEKSDIYQGTSSVYMPGEQLYGSLPVGPEEDTKNATVHVLYPYRFIAHPYGIKTVGVDEPNVELFMDNNTEKITPTIDTNPVQLSNYTVTYSKPVYLYSSLKNPTEVYQPSLQERYLQLPNTLPTRVRKLASEIVEGKETPYDKARAIEMYFRQNGFRYDTDEVAIPTDEQDYVDQFLFETKVGYCDNFSTSMVVLLRSIGIPARWVKGFAGGDQIDSNGSMKTFEITNNDAHSWVEAYIPNVGWVNFEPTIGFNNTRSIDYDLQTDAYQEERLTVDEETEPDEKVEEKEETPEKVKQESQFATNIKNSLNKNKFLILGGLLLVAVIIILLYKKRKKWLPKVYLQVYKRRKLDDSSVEVLYLHLLKVLEAKGFKRQNGQTLQSFAKEIDTYFETNHMSTLTKAYEQYIYSKDASKIDFDKMKESWEYLINQTSS